MPADNLDFTAPGVAAVRWELEGKLVLVEWEGWSNSKEFAALLAAELQALTENHGSRLLADCRRQRVLSPADQARDKAWLPLAIADGLRRFAIFPPTSGLATTNIRDRLGTTPGSTFDIAYFSTVDEARTWLTGKPGPAV
jgi:hypothetical protein